MVRGFWGDYVGMWRRSCICIGMGGCTMNFDDDDDDDAYDHDFFPRGFKGLCQVGMSCVCLSCLLSDVDCLHVL
jgi:hypothetical protein